MTVDHLLVAFAVGGGAAVVSVIAAILTSRLIRRSVPRDLVDLPDVEVELAPGRVASLGCQSARCLVEDLLLNSHPEVHVVPTGAEGEMAYRGEIWDSLSSIRSRYLRLTEMDEPIVGIHKVPYWLTNAATPEEAWDACEEYLERQVRQTLSQGLEKRGKR